MIPLSTFSTGDLSGSDRLKSFARYIARTMVHDEPEIQGASTFHAEAEAMSLGLLAACRLHADPHRVCLPDSARPRDRWGLCRVLFQIAGHTVIDEDDAHLEMGPGDWVLNSSAHPFRLTNADRVSQIVLFVPAIELSSDRAIVEKSRRRVFRSASGIGRLLFGFVEGCVRENGAISGGATFDLANSTLTLLRAALRELLPPDEIRRPGEILRERVRAIVQRRIADPSLSIDAIARALNCSKRYIHLAFHEEATTLTRLILSERLERCRSDLADPRRTTRPIGEIALSWGFKDAAHFSRLFRRHFAMSPTEYRAQLR
jgi:AraC-like DNA-binding protein